MSKPAPDATFQTSNGTRIKAILEVISPLLIEAILIFRKDSIVIEGVGSSLFIKAHLRPTNADSYSIKGLEHRVGLDVKALTTVARAVSLGDLICIELPHNHDGAIDPVFIFKHWNEKKITEYPIAILDIPRLKTPILDDDARYSMTAVDPVLLYTEVKYLSRVGVQLQVLAPNLKQLVLKAFDKKEKIKGWTAIPATIDEKNVNGAKSFIPMRDVRLIAKASIFKGRCWIGVRSNGGVRIKYELGSGSLTFSLEGSTKRPRDQPTRSLGVPNAGNSS